MPVVFGEYGVGKTTVVRRVLRDLGHESSLVYIPTAAGKTMSDVFKVALEHLGYSVVVEQVDMTSKGARFGAKLIFEGDLEEGSSKTITTRMVVDSPTDELIASLLRDKKLTIVIDELHRADANFRIEVADLIKTTHGQTSNFPQIVLIGTTLDSAELVAVDQGIDRFIKELRISPMTEDEARAVIISGFETLETELPTELMDLVIRTSAGAPSLIQSICLEMAEAALEREPKAVIKEDYEAAVGLYLSEHGSRLVEAYNAAIEHTGPRRYKKQLLISMSMIDDEFFELDVVRSHIEKRLGIVVERTALSGPLRDLKIGEDPVLQDVTQRDGSRVHNLTAFRDPMMKSFIRFMHELEAQGLVGE